MTFSIRDATRLLGVHPDLQTRLARVLEVMASAGHPMLVIEGVRTEGRQRALYAQGRTAPGAIVTNCDGVARRSNHQAHKDGYGHAVDCAFLIGGLASWLDALPWSLYGQTAQHEGLIWGGAWIGAAATLYDRPHVELP